MCELCSLPHIEPCNKDAINFKKSTKVFHQKYGKGFVFDDYILDEDADDNDIELVGVEFDKEDEQAVKSRYFSNYRGLEFDWNSKRFLEDSRIEKVCDVAL